MSLMVGGSFPRALQPFIGKYWGDGYKDYPFLYPEIFEVEKAAGRFVINPVMVMLGYAQKIGEGDAVPFDAGKQVGEARYTVANWGLGFHVSRDLVMDKQYPIVERMVKDLKRKMALTLDNEAADILNNAFVTTYNTGWDGKELCATDHKNGDGTTYKNELTTSADLSEASLEQSLIDIRNFTDLKGIPALAVPRKLVIPINEEANAHRLVYSEHRVGTADNDINATKHIGMFPDGIVVHPLLTDTDAFFIKTSMEDGLKLYMREEATMPEAREDNQTLNISYISIMRFVLGWNDPKGIFGSPGG